MSTHNIGFYEEMKKIISLLSSNIIKYVLCSSDETPSWTPVYGTLFPGDLFMQNISMTNFPLSLIQEVQLSVTVERMCTEYS